MGLPKLALAFITGLAAWSVTGGNQAFAAACTTTGEDECYCGDWTPASPGPGTPRITVPALTPPLPPAPPPSIIPACPYGLNSSLYSFVVTATESLNDWKNVSSDLSYANWATTINGYYGQPPNYLGDPVPSLTSWLKGEPSNMFAYSTGVIGTWGQLIFAAWAQDILAGSTAGIDWVKLLEATDVGADALQNDPALSSAMGTAWQEGFNCQYASGCPTTRLKTTYNWISAVANIAQDIVDEVSAPLCTGATPPAWATDD